MLYVNPQLQAGFKEFQLSPGADRREARALQEFERLFLFQMLKEMRKTVEDSGLFGSGMKRQYFEEMLDDVMAGEMAQSGQLGIARQMAEQLHAKHAVIAPSPIQGSEPGRGISLETLRAGIPVSKAAPAGIPIPEAMTGIPMGQAAKVQPLANTSATESSEASKTTTGIPMSRAHDSYQEHR